MSLSPKEQIKYINSISNQSNMAAFIPALHGFQTREILNNDFCVMSSVDIAAMGTSNFGKDTSYIRYLGKLIPFMNQKIHSDLKFWTTEDELQISEIIRQTEGSSHKLINDKKNEVSNPDSRIKATTVPLNSDFLNKIFGLVSEDEEDNSDSKNDRKQARSLLFAGDKLDSNITFLYKSDIVREDIFKKYKYEIIDGELYVIDNDPFLPQKYKVLLSNRLFLHSIDTNKLFPQEINIITKKDKKDRQLYCYVYSELDISDENKILLIYYQYMNLLTCKWLLAFIDPNYYKDILKKNTQIIPYQTSLSSIWIENKPLTSMNIVGITLVAVGLISYSYFKEFKNNEKKIKII
jgi:hypothetical protein